MFETHREIIMQRTKSSLLVVLMLAAITAHAQDKMKDPPKTGHEGMAKAGGAQSDAAVIAKATSAAPADIDGASNQALAPESSMRQSSTPSACSKSAAVSRSI